MKNISSYLVHTCLFSLVLFSASATAQKSGQSIQIQYGVVVGSNYIKEKSKAPIGALIGGGIGLLTAKGKSGSTKVVSTAAGAAVGGLGTKAVQGNLDAREYTVQTASGQVVIISDQTEIQVDDCVVVENPGTGNANIRRVAATMCYPESADVVAELNDEMMEEAEECVAAKKELVAAETDAAVDRAMRKISILCDS